MDLLITFFVSLGINLVMFVPAFILKTDKLTDISYAVTFVVVALFGLFSGEIDILKVVYVGAITLWAVRLGGYLLIRIKKMGKDSRFDGMRNSFFKFLRFWVLQGLTVWVVMIPGTLFLNGFSSDNIILPVIGGMLFLFGLLVELIADLQKYRFINNPENKGKWIDSGLWSISRHPNYLGEITVWFGLYIFILPSIFGWHILAALLGPLFITCMILFVSGVPILEKGADDRWGNDPRYQKYKKDTGVLMPKIF